MYRDHEFDPLTPEEEARRAEEAEFARRVRREVRRMERGGRAIFRRIKRKRNPGLFQGQTAHKKVPGFLFLRCEFFPCAVVRTCLRTGCMCPEYILRKCIKYEYILQITHKDAT